MKLEYTRSCNWETINYLEGFITEPIWEWLTKERENIPKMARIKVSLHIETI